MQSAKFIDVLQQMIPGSSFGALCERRTPHTRGGQKLDAAPPPCESIIFRQLEAADTLAEHWQRLHGIGMTGNSANVQHWARLPVEFFESLMEATARAPLAARAAEAEQALARSI